MQRRAFLAGLLGTAAVPLYAESGRLSVVATTGMIADLATQIGGSHVTVRALMGPGVDPHAYRQTRSDIVAMTQADLLLWHGLYLEAQMEDFFAKIADRVPVTPVAEALPESSLIAHDEYDGRFDPHVWMDARLWSAVAEQVARTLSAAKPSAADDIQGNLAAFQSEADALETYSRDVLSQVPADQRVLVTAHDAFGYFGQAYGYDVLGIQGISTESEAGLNRISELVDFIVDKKLKAVFVETSVSDRNVRALIEGAQARGHTVEIGGALYSDAMGTPGTYEGTWLGMIDHNVTTISNALGANAPARGRLGLLEA